jgi:Uncharacterized protein conserved in bacteria
MHKSNTQVTFLPPGSTIGVVAGQGQFPVLVADAARDQGFKVAICGFHGHTDQNIAARADAFAMFHLGQLGHVIRFFQKQNASHICFAGAISKPKALSIRPDFTAVKMLMSLRGFGDDALLRAVAKELENKGITVIQAASLIPGLPGPLGLLTKRNPSQEEWENILFGWPKAQAIGRLDIGQCIVVREKMVMAVECLEGTDATLRRGAELGGKGALAIKIVKPGQDERIDLPAIGLDTIKNLIAGKYSCLAYHAGKTLFFDREESVDLANKNGLTLIGLPGGLDAHTPFYNWFEQQSPDSAQNFIQSLKVASLS